MSIAGQYWKKVFTPLIFIICLLCLCSFSVYANPNWNSWGNAGIDYSGTFFDNLLFGSNYPQGNLNFTLVSVTNNQGYTPLVQDFNYDGQNEIATFYASNVKLYDNRGTVLSSYDVNGTIVSNAVVTNIDQDYYPEMAFMTSVTGGYRFYILEAEESVLTLKANYFYSYGTTMTGSLFGGIDAATNGDVYVVTTPNDVIKFNYLTNTSTIYNRTFASYSAVQSAAGSYFYGSGVSSGKINGILNIYWVASPGGSGTPIRAMRFDTNTNTISYKASTIVTGAAAVENYEAMFVNIGSPSSDPEVVIYEGATNGNQATLDVMDYSLSNILYSKNAHQEQNIPQYPAVADINKDGSNELCVWFRDTRNISCYSSAGATVTTSQFTYPPTSFIAIGTYVSDDPFMNIITARGIYAFNTTGNSTLVYPFLTNTSTCMILPVAIENKASYKKDILSICGSEMNYYIGSATAAVCGNDICEYSETVFNCFDDCFDTTTNATVGNIPAGGQCLDNSWCASGICDAGVCTGLPAGAACTSDNQCASGDCTENNICGLTDNVQVLGTLVELLGFRSALSKILLSLIIIIASTIAGAGIMFSVAPSPGTAMIGALLGMVVGLIAVVVVFSWLGVFFLFAFFFLLIMLFLGFKILTGDGG